MRELVVVVVLVSLAGFVDSLYFGGTYSHAANQMLSELIQHIK
jgi:hypothetical protein